MEFITETVSYWNKLGFSVSNFLKNKLIYPLDKEPVMKEVLKTFNRNQKIKVVKRYAKIRAFPL